MTNPITTAIAAVIRQHLNLEDFQGDQMFEGLIDPDELAEAITATLK